MFQRKITEKLLAWKADEKRKPLIVTGLRQIGKTTIVTDFGAKEYSSVLFFDFRKNKSLQSAFDGDFKVDDIVARLTAFSPSAPAVPHRTLFIFDEIQDCPNARSSLKYFALDGRYDVIATGSLLGVKGYRRSKKPSRGIPVGFEDTIQMYPMDFEEFCWAAGVNSTALAEIKRDLAERKTIPAFYHQMFLDLFRQYLCVGGMPEVVETYLATHDMNQVLAKQRRILADYKSDFGTHLNDDMEIEVDVLAQAKILACFDSIPNQLAKENKKFQYSLVGKNGRGKDYYEALEWLEDYGVIQPCYALSSMEKPLNVYKKDDSFKIYMADTGLYVAMLEAGTSASILTGELGVSKGAIYENIVADAFGKMGKNLYYYRQDSGLEIDFVTMIQGEVSLIEVKAKDGNAKSAKTILADPAKFGVHQAIKLSAQNIGGTASFLSLPYYLAFDLA
jgi:uncharacterized protein